MSLRTITPLSMSQTKEELLRHLGMSTDIYELMALETANIYTWLTSNPASFKPKSNQTPPYDWSDITELAKQNAAIQLANSTDARTAPYWQMGATYSNDNNWVAVWFLYHKFRYRDGRNRAKDSKKGTTKHRKSGSDSKKSKSSSSQLGSASNRSSQSLGSPETLASPVYYEQNSAPVAYITTEYAKPVVQYSTYPVTAGAPYFDPARDKYTTLN